MAEQDNEDAVKSLRETDRWLRRVAVYIPILAFVAGWGSGVVSTFLLFKDHERRITILEAGQKDDDILLRAAEIHHRRVIDYLQQKFGAKLE